MPKVHLDLLRIFFWEGIVDVNWYQLLNFSWYILKELKYIRLMLDIYIINNAMSFLDNTHLYYAY